MTYSKEAKRKTNRKKVRYWKLLQEQEKMKKKKCLPIINVDNREIKMLI